jgi:hypothetical protein
MKRVQMRPPDLAQDRPIERSGDDRLNRLPFVENLVRALVIDERDITGRVIARHSSGVVVGLTGKWGSGKSSVLNMLTNELRCMDHVAVATLNPWLFRGREELLSAFFNELRDAVGRSPNERVREAVKALDRYREAITVAGHSAALLADAHGAGGAATTGWKPLAKVLKVIRKPKDLSPQQERRALEKKLADANVAVVVLIDELDRVEDDDVRAVAQLVKAVGDIKGLSYLVAYDPERVADALGRGSGEERRRSGEAYLEKIVQHPVPLRPLFTNDVVGFLDALLTHHGLTLPGDLSDAEMEVVTYIQNVAETPRDLKRLVGAYAVLDRMLRQEVSPADLLGYCWLLTKAPAVRDLLSAKLDRVVEDPDQNEIIRRVTNELDHKKPDLEETLGAAALPHRDLIELLFPRFGKGHHRDSGNRLFRRRNLVRTLYLGDPPGIANRATVEALWVEKDEDALEAKLRELIAKDELRSIIDRLDDLLPQLPESGDLTFWLSFARVLIRDHDWYLQPEPHHALADDAATHLVRLGFRHPGQIGRIKKIISALASENDLIIVPWVLRKHLFRWGLTIHDKGERYGDFIFDREETEALRDANMHVYRQALLDGRLLRRTPNSEALFALSNAALWDDELRQSLTLQLESYEGRASMAALVVPPGHGIDRSSLENLFDAGRIQSLIEATAEGQDRTTWIGQCLNRLRRALSGKDTMFDDHD